MKSNIKAQTVEERKKQSCTRTKWIELRNVKPKIATVKALNSELANQKLFHLSSARIFWL